jgi:hypothetical protein
MMYSIPIFWTSPRSASYIPHISFLIISYELYIVESVDMYLVVIHSIINLNQLRID